MRTVGNTLKDNDIASNPEFIVAFKEFYRNLSKQQREIIRLKILKMTDGEIAQRVCIRKDSVRVELFRIRAKFNALL